MIRVCLHSENLSAGCMTHSVRNIARYINKNIFEVYLATTDTGCYGPEVLKEFKPSNVFVYRREPGKMYEYYPETGEYPEPVAEHPLYDWLESKKIDIVHDQRGGQAYFPLNSPRIKAKKIEYNIFGGFDAHEDIARSLCISQGVYNDWLLQMQRRAPHLAQRGMVLNPAVSFPDNNEDLRSELGIPSDYVVIGRSSNAGGGDIMNLQAYAKVENDKTIFLSPATHSLTEPLIKSLGIKNIVTMPLITDYRRMSMYYNTLDIAAHDRGESFGCSVAEALMHGTPVVSNGWSCGNYSPATAQEELIDDINYCAVGGNPQQRLMSYAGILQRLIRGGRDYCKSEGRRFQQRIMAKCSAPVITRQLEQIYGEVLR